MLLENGLYAMVRPEKGAYQQGIVVRVFPDSFYKFGGFEPRSEDDVPKDDIEAVKYNLEHCHKFIGDISKPYLTDLIKMRDELLKKRND